MVDGACAVQAYRSGSPDIAAQDRPRTVADRSDLVGIAGGTQAQFSPVTLAATRPAVTLQSQGHSLVNNEAYFPPSEVPQAVIDALSDQIGGHLRSLVPKDLKAFGDRVNSTVDAMVAPSARELYRDPSAIIGLATFEVGNIGLKIRRYQFIERYKFFADLPDADMGMAFGEHMYAVRNAELYTILERGEAVVRFGAALAADLGVGDQKAATVYSKQYRAEFEHRLRECHRMTHAHERPSLVSRILQLGKIKTEEERKVVGDILGGIVRTMVAAFKLIQERLPEEDRMPSMLDPVAFQRSYLQRNDTEAASMWCLFADAMLGAVGSAANPAD